MIRAIRQESKLFWLLTQVLFPTSSHRPLPQPCSTLGPLYPQALPRRPSSATLFARQLGVSSYSFSTLDAISACGRVKVTFIDLDIQPSESCNQDKLQLLGEDESNILGIFCGTDIPRPVVSEKGDRKLHMKFGTDYMGAGRGFHLYYEASPYIDDCPPNHIRCKNLELRSSHC
ncbi:Cubilin like protein [Argiope bruennichi]|uniref:Cubilin like protein n=1 Tax=Argiope bruennichi TaxID=94029 RepID=A0A8T0FSV5_ARGBR|nr:Cubilin like protein [Argiope bruennichi]